MFDPGRNDAVCSPFDFSGNTRKMEEIIMTKITMTANKGQPHVQRAVGATRWLFVLSLCLIIAPSAWGDLQAGKDAYTRKDYATAREELQPSPSEAMRRRSTSSATCITKAKAERKTVQRPQNGFARPQTKAIPKRACASA